VADRYRDDGPGSPMTEYPVNRVCRPPRPRNADNPQVWARKSGPLRRTCGRITCGSGVCVGLPAVLRTAGRRLLLDRSHLTRPKSIQLWTTSFPVYDDGT